MITEKQVRAIEDMKCVVIYDNKKKGGGKCLLRVEARWDNAEVIRLFLKMNFQLLQHIMC